MKREGTFCDFGTEPCPRVAVGACISCGKDVCSNHGSAKGVSVSIRYEAEGAGGGTVQMVVGDLATCVSCLRSIRTKSEALSEHLLPGVLAQVTEGVRVTLAVEAMKK